MITLVANHLSAEAWYALSFPGKGVNMISSMERLANLSVSAADCASEDRGLSSQ